MSWEVGQRYQWAHPTTAQYTLRVDFVWPDGWAAVTVTDHYSGESRHATVGPGSAGNHSPEPEHGRGVPGPAPNTRLCLCGKPWPHS